MTGNLLLELGEVEKAQQCLGRWFLFAILAEHRLHIETSIYSFRAIVISPDVGHTKYMTAAQLFPGTQSRDLYLKVRQPSKYLLREINN